VVAMTAREAISDKDLQALLRIVTRPDLGDDGRALPRSTMAGLLSLIPSEFVEFAGLDWSHRRWDLYQNTYHLELESDEGSPCSGTTSGTRSVPTPNALATCEVSSRPPTSTASANTGVHLCTPTNYGPKISNTF